MTTRVLVGGGTGFIGQKLCTLLRNTGYNVTVISRKSTRERNVITWDDLKRSGLPPDTYAVVNLAGQNILDIKKRWNTDFKKLIWNSRVETTSILSKLIGESGGKPECFVCISGVGIYQPIPGVTYREDYKPHSFDFFSNLCIELEKAAHITSKSKCRQVTIRSGVVLGKDGGICKNLYLPFVLGLGGPVLPGTQILPWIHIQDLCRLIHFALKQPVTGVLNGVAPETITNTEFSKAYGKALNRPAFIPLPQAVLNVLLNEERAKLLTTGQKVLPVRATALGFQFLFPNIQSACEEIVSSPAPPPF